MADAQNGVDGAGDDVRVETSEAKIRAVSFKALSAQIGCEKAGSTLRKEPYRQRLLLSHDTQLREYPLRAKAFETRMSIYDKGFLTINQLPGYSDTAASFEFLDEDHTMGNALRYMIMKKYVSHLLSITPLDSCSCSRWLTYSPLYNSPEVEFCGYSIPHPAEAKMNIRIQTYGKNYDELQRSWLFRLTEIIFRRHNSVGCPSKGVGRSDGPLQCGRGEIRSCKGRVHGG